MERQVSVGMSLSIAFSITTYTGVLALDQPFVVQAVPQTVMHYLSVDHMQRIERVLQTCVARSWASAALRLV